MPNFGKLYAWRRYYPESSKATGISSPAESKIPVASIMMDEDEQLKEQICNDYLKSIVSARNKLAHRKLELNEECSVVYSFSTINEYLNSDRNIIDHYSLDEWIQIRKKVMDYGQQFDSLLIELIGEKEN